MNIPPILCTDVAPCTHSSLAGAGTEETHCKGAMGTRTSAASGDWRLFRPPASALGGSGEARASASALRFLPLSLRGSGGSDIACSGSALPRSATRAAPTAQPCSIVACGSQ